MVAMAVTVVAAAVGILAADMALAEALDVDATNHEGSVPWEVSPCVCLARGIK